MRSGNGLGALQGRQDASSSRRLVLLVLFAGAAAAAALATWLLAREALALIAFQR